MQTNKLKLAKQTNIKVIKRFESPECPIIIICYSVYNLNNSTRYRADWFVPAITYSTVNISCVKTFKTSVKWGIILDEILTCNNIK